MIERTFKKNGNFGSAKITFGRDVMSQSGFKIGDKVNVIVKNNEIIIKKGD